MKPGCKVVCVDAEASAEVRGLFTHWPVKGTIYVVRDVLPGCSRPGHGFEGNQTAVTLLGMVNPRGVAGMFIGHEMAYNAKRFREIEEKSFAQRAEENTEAGK